MSDEKRITKKKFSSLQELEQALVSQVKEQIQTQRDSGVSEFVSEAKISVKPASGNSLESVAPMGSSCYEICINLAFVSFCYTYCT